MEIINPATEEIITSLDSTKKEELNEIIKTLRKSQRSWKKKTVEERLSHIVKFGELVENNGERLARILTSETGKPIQQSLGEIKGANNRIEHLKAYAAQWLQPEVMKDKGSTHEHIAYEPLGVIANISAWNFPYNVGYNVFLYALVAGNAVVYKPSEFASLTGIELMKLLHEAGIPKDIFTCVIGGADIGKALLEQDLDGYFFTGSYRTGVSIAKAIAHKLVPVQLELGGKDPLYVMDDVADVKQAAINAAEGAFYNNGQSCCAVERIYVHENIYNDFVSHFEEEVKSYVQGDPKEKETFLGPLTRSQQIAVIQNQVDEAVYKGAKVLVGGRKREGKGYYYLPTVLTDVTHEMEVMKEESFGPIIGIQKVGSDEEALSLMQDTPYGLTSAVFSSDRERAQNLFNELNTGTVYWNCCDRVSPNVPWSGRKQSGIGSTLSHQGIRAFVQPKAYHMRS